MVHVVLGLEVRNCTSSDYNIKERGKINVHIQSAISSVIKFNSGRLCLTFQTVLDRRKLSRNNANIPLFFTLN